VRTPLKFLVVSIATLWLASCTKEPALLRQMSKLELVNKIQHRLLESVEAEKSAVLAVTDEESIEFAAQSKRSVEEIDRLQSDLSQLIAADARREEVETLAAFTAMWAELKGIDVRLLDLAVANSNLKASRLSAKEGAAALDRFITSVDAMARSSSDVAIVRSLTTAATSAARIHSLLLAHIPEASDDEMTALEARIRALGATVDTALRESRASLPPTASSSAAEAAQAWAEYQRVMAEVIRLSRLNTNVISFDVSIHEKRTATRACSDALAALRSAIESGPHATR